MKTMKRALTLIMAVMMVAAMAACGNKPAASNGDETTGDGPLPPTPNSSWWATTWRSPPRSLSVWA